MAEMSNQSSFNPALLWGRSLLTANFSLPLAVVGLVEVGFVDVSNVEEVG